MDQIIAARPGAARPRSASRCGTSPPTTRPTSACPRSAAWWCEDFGSDDSPAKTAGLEPGDIIVSVDGKPVEYVGQLQQQIAFRQPGEMVKVEVARKGGVRKTFDVKLQELPAADARSRSRDSGAADDHRRRDRRRLGRQAGHHRRADRTTTTCSSCISSRTSAARW